MRCTSCNEPTKVVDSRPRSDGAIRRRRECTACGRRFSTEELPGDARWIGELPAATHGDGGPLEAVRRKAILSAARDENARAMVAAVTELGEIVDRMEAMLESKERT